MYLKTIYPSLTCFFTTLLLVGCSKGLVQIVKKSPAPNASANEEVSPTSFFTDAAKNPIVEPPKPEEVSLPEIVVPGEKGEVLVFEPIGASPEEFEQLQNDSADTGTGGAPAGTVSVIRETKPLENSESRNALAKLVDGLINRAKAFEIFGGEFRRILESKTANIQQSVSQVDEIKDLAQIIADLHNAENTEEAQSRILDELVGVLGSDMFNLGKGSSNVDDIEDLFVALRELGTKGMVSPQHDTFLIYYLYFQQHSKNNSPDPGLEINIGENALAYFTERLASANAKVKSKDDQELATALFAAYSLIENIFEDKDWIVKNLGPLAMSADLRKLGRSSQETFAAVIEAQLQLNSSHLLSAQFLKNALAQAEFAVRLLSPNKQRALVSSRYFNFSVNSIDRLNRVMDRHPREFNGFSFQDWMEISDLRITKVLRPLEKALRENDLLANRLRTVFTAPLHPYTQIYWGRAFMTEKNRDLVAKVAFEIPTADQAIAVLKNRINILGGGVSVFAVPAGYGSLENSTDADLVANYLGSLMSVEAIRYSLMSKSFSSKSHLLATTEGYDLESYRKIQAITEQALGIRFADRLKNGGLRRQGCEGVMSDQLKELSFYLCNLILSNPELEKEIQMSSGVKTITKKYLYLGPGIYSESDALNLNVETLEFHPLALVRLKPESLTSPVANLNLKVKNLIEPWFESFGNGFDPNAADRPSGLSGRPAAVKYRPEGGEYFHVYTSGEWPPPPPPSTPSDTDSSAIGRPTAADKQSSSSNSGADKSSTDSSGAGGGSSTGGSDGGTIKGEPRLDFDPFDSMPVAPSFKESFNAVSPTEMFFGKNNIFTDAEKTFVGNAYTNSQEISGAAVITGFRRDLLRFYQLPIQTDPGAAVPNPPNANPGQAAGSFRVEIESDGTLTGIPLFGSFGGNGESGFKGSDSPYWNGSTYVAPPRVLHFASSGMTFDGAFQIEVHDPANTRFQIYAPHIGGGNGSMGGAGGDAGGVRIVFNDSSASNYPLFLVTIPGQAGRSGQPGFPRNIQQVTPREHFNFDVVVDEGQVGPQLWSEYGPSNYNNSSGRGPNPYKMNQSHWSPGISPLNTQPHWVQRTINTFYYHFEGWLEGSDRKEANIHEIWRNHFNEYEVFRDHATNAANNLNTTNYGDRFGIDIVNNTPDWAWTYAVNQRNSEALRPGMDSLRSKLSSFINDQIQPLTFPSETPQSAPGKSGQLVIELKR